MVTNVAVAKVCALLSGLHVCMYVCYQLFSKTAGQNCMKQSGMICHHPRTNRLDFGSDQVKGQGYKRSKTTGPNCMKFSGMICHCPRTNRLDFGSNQVKGHGQVTKRSKTYFCHNMPSFRPIHMKPMPKCSIFNSLSSDKCGVGEGMLTTEYPF